jgi:hypothetical protein
MQPTLKIALVSTVLALASCAVLPLPHTTNASPPVTGRVVDSKSRIPVPDAVVRLAANRRVTALTDAEGSFRLRASHNFHLLLYWNPSFTAGWPAGSYSDKIEILHPGYPPYAVEVKELYEALHDAKRQSEQPLGSFEPISHLNNESFDLGTIPLKK